LSLRRTAMALTATLLVLFGLLVAKSGGRPRNTSQLQAVGAQLVITSPAVAVAHGIVQVRVTMAGDRITDVAALQLPHDNNESWELSVHAAAILRSEALRAQSADIDTVSGATYTSRAYAHSLQAALDSAP
jgi:uncharacterized protein with FMN-binding domain